MKKGQRLILRRLCSRVHEEHLIDELSPSGKMFKSRGAWLLTDDYRVIEELPPTKDGSLPEHEG